MPRKRRLDGINRDLRKTRRGNGTGRVGGRRRLKTLGRPRRGQRRSAALTNTHYCIYVFVEFVQFVGRFEDFRISDFSSDRVYFFGRRPFRDAIGPVGIADHAFERLLQLAEHFTNLNEHNTCIRLEFVIDENSLSVSPSTVLLDRCDPQ